MREPDLFSAAALRDSALARIRAGNPTWLDRGIALIRRIDPGVLITGEHVRLSLLEAGIGTPTHHNAWGALIRTAVKRGLLIHTGVFVPMVTAKSHARLTPQYRVRKP